MTLTREQVQAYLELANKATMGRWIISYGDDDTADEIYANDGSDWPSSIAEGLLRVDSQFIAESHAIARPLANALLQAWDANEMLRSLLKRCEWSAEVSGHWEEAGCPICGSWQGSERHENDCELRQALEDEQ